MPLQWSLLKNPKGGGSESFQVGEHMHIWGEWHTWRAWELQGPFPVCCSMHLFHPADPELDPFIINRWGFPGGSPGKEPACQRRTWKRPRVRSLGWEDSLEKELATHSSILAWKIPWPEEPGRPQSMGLWRVGHNWVHTACTHTHTHIHTHNKLVI